MEYVSSVRIQSTSFAFEDFDSSIYLINIPIKESWWNLKTQPLNSDLVVSLKKSSIQLEASYQEQNFQSFTVKMRFIVTWMYFPDKYHKNVDIRGFLWGNKTWCMIYIIWCMLSPKNLR